MSASGIYNYNALAGSGSDTFLTINGSGSWRAALLGTVAAGALWSMTPKPARAGPALCTTVGNVTTCQGDQSGGIASGVDFNPATVDTLNVNTLSTNVTPPSGTSGIYFHRSGAYNNVTINSNTSPFSISVTGAGANGIDAAGTDTITINHTGDITSAAGSGIVAQSQYGNINIVSSGKINAFGDGIIATVNSARTNAYNYFVNGAVSITHTGDITSANGIGVNAYSHYGDVNVTTTGNINSHGTGISAKAGTSYGYYASGGSVTVRHTGDITSSNGRGVDALALAGNIYIKVVGNITAHSDGIYATTSSGFTSGYGNITVKHTGDITSQQGSGIVTTALLGSTYVNVAGNITAHDYGVISTALNNAQIIHSGDITARIGIFAYTGLGNVDITSTGKISTTSDAIFAKVSTGAYNGYSFGPSSGHVYVTHSGDITSTHGRGIYAASYYGSVKVYNTGNIKSAGNGITAIVSPGYYGSSYGNVTVHQTGDITSYHGSGIIAASYQGSVTVVSAGNITADGDGIQALGFTGVTVSHTGDIMSAHANGIYAYSPTGPVSVTTVGNITAYNNGIVALSVVNDVTVQHTGNITAQNTGIYTRSVAGNINVTVNGGTVFGGYAGIQVYGGVTNTVTVGAGATVSGGSFAILGNTGNTTVYNSGTVIGNVALGSGSNAFNNLAGGVFDSGVTVDLGGGTLTNSGTLSPGGLGTVLTTALTGNLVQSAGGKFAVDVNLAGGTADRLNVSGTASLNGMVVPNLTSIGSIGQVFTILSATGGTTINGLTVLDTAVIDYQLIYPNANDVQLTITSLNFATPGLTPNQTAVAQHLQGAFLAGGGGLSNLLLFLLNQTPAAFAADLDKLHPEPYLAQAQSLLLSGFDFGNSLFSCPAPSDAGHSVMGEDSCLWVRPNWSVGSYSAQPGYIGFNEKATGITGGVQNMLMPNWYLDLGFGYDRSNIDVDDRSTARGDVFHGGAALKYIQGNWLVAGSVSGSFASYDTTRFGIPTTGSATAQAQLGTLDFRTRFAYAFGAEAFYIKPMVDFDLVGLWRDAINESGAGPLSLMVQSQTDWMGSVAPAVEFGAQWRQGIYVWRPYLRVGARFLSQDTLSATALFAGSPAGVSPFTVTTPLDQALAEVSAGFDVWQTDRYSLRLGYNGRFGAHSSMNGGELKLRASF